jgi:hypothetical protein
VAHSFVVHLPLVPRRILLLQFFLFYFSLPGSFIYSNLREVPGRRCSGFLGIPGLKEMANMER